MAFLRKAVSWLQNRRRRPGNSLSTSSSEEETEAEERQCGGRDATVSETTVDTSTTIDDDHAEQRRKEQVERRKMKAKKAHRKPLPKKIHQKRKEKKKKQRKRESEKRKNKKDVLVKDEEGRIFLRRRPIPDDPMYEGIVRTLMEEMPVETEQDVLDGIYVRAVANELKWMEVDEEQMLPRIETLPEKENKKLKRERASEVWHITQAFNTWSWKVDKYKTPEIADILVSKKNQDAHLVVPWIGIDEHRSDSEDNNDRHKHLRFRKRKKKHSKRKPKKVVEETEEQSDDEQEEKVDA